MYVCNNTFTAGIQMWSYGLVWCAAHIYDIFSWNSSITFAEGSRDESNCSICVFESYLPKGILGREGKEGIPCDGLFTINITNSAAGANRRRCTSDRSLTHSLAPRQTRNAARDFFQLLEYNKLYCRTALTRRPHYFPLLPQESM